MAIPERVVAEVEEAFGFEKPFILPNHQEVNQASAEPVHVEVYNAEPVVGPFDDMGRTLFP